VTDLPSGTVTFLFTDVEGSTRLLHDLGDGYADVLAAHRRLLRAAFARHRGVEVDTQGDAFFVAFSKASDAVAAAVEGQDVLRASPVRVRMGLHTGEPLVTSEGYVGIDVHRAARIAAVGHGRQILVSQSTRDLVGTDGLRDLGEHRLKDLTAAERIYQLGVGEFPPLRSLHATNLPVVATVLVGRERELAELQSLLRGPARLVTLTGAGGSGKTRLGLQVAAELVDHFPGGVFFVPLAETRVAAHVEGSITRAAGVGNLADFRDRKTMLVVDNFEHLLEAATVISDLLSVAPAVTVLATSRAPLRVSGEHEYAVDPLAPNDALELLTQRARAVRADFQPTAAAEEICRRLDRLPLALELAASRLRSLGTDALLSRLDERLPLLTSGRRDAPARQRTLRATIEWSYELLPAELQDIFIQLAVFSGTFSLEAAESVAEATLDDLDPLVEASLVKHVGKDRLLMLETIREFAAERLSQVDARGRLERRHAEHYLRVAESTNFGEETEGRTPNHELAVADLANFRRALGWATQSGATELGLDLMLALQQFWVVQAPHEGRRWLEGLLERMDDVPTRLHAQAKLVHGGLLFIVGEFERGTRIYEQSLAEFRALGDERGVGAVLNRLIYAAVVDGEYAKARTLARDSLDIHRRLGNLSGEAAALGALADAEWRAGEQELAVELARESVDLARRGRFDWWCVGMLTLLCEWSYERAEHAEADHVGLDALELAHRIGDRQHRAYLLALLSRFAAESGEPERAGVLWGALELQEERGPIGQWENERAKYAEPVLAHAGPTFERGREDGRRMSLDEAIVYALAARD
jgi:predicted ATPase/class 3 adenylate cyclase